MRGSRVARGQLAYGEARHVATEPDPGNNEVFARDLDVARLRIAFDRNGPPSRSLSIILILIEPVTGSGHSP